MRMVYINSAKPVAATVQTNEFDSEPVLLPLTPQAQKAFSRRARNTRFVRVIGELMVARN